VGQESHSLQDVLLSHQAPSKPPTPQHKQVKFQAHTTISETSQVNNPFHPEAQSWLNRAIRRSGVKKAFHWAHPMFFHRYAVFGGTSFSYQLPGRIYKNSMNLHEVCSTVVESQTAEDESGSETDVEEKLERQRDKSEDANHQHEKDLMLKYLDVFHRKTRSKIEVRRVDPTSGQLENLVIQATPAVYNQPNKTTWRRTYIENISPYLIRLAYWPKAGRNHVWVQEDWMYVGLKWLPACVGILIMVCSRYILYSILLS
jgi:hypothetical protein